MFDELMISGDRLRPVDGGGVRLQARLPFYRSLPLSCIEGLELSIDGVAPDAVDVFAGDDRYALAQISSLSDTWWFVLDALDLEIRLPEPLEPGSHRVAMTMRFRVPHGDPDFRVGVFVQVARCTRRMRLEPSEAPR
jgi:hypothetical protein